MDGVQIYSLILTALFFIWITYVGIRYFSKPLKEFGADKINTVIYTDTK